MSASKTLIRYSLSCLEFRARAPCSTAFCHFSSSLSFQSGRRFKIQKQSSVSRSFCFAAGVISLENSGCTDESAPGPVTLEIPQHSEKDTVEELLLKKKDDVSRLMKLERRPENDQRRDRWFPYLNRFKAGDGWLSSKEVLEAMDPCIMDARKERFRNVVNNRTYSVCLVVEGLSDVGNVSAAFRSADALGIQSVHVVSCGNSKRYRDNRHVSMGAEKWLDIELWSSIKECFGVLKSRGYRIITTHLGMDAVVRYQSMISIGRTLLQ